MCSLPEESFDFLGYTIGRCYSWRTGHAYLGTRPSRKAVRRVVQAISEEAGRRWWLTDVGDRVTRLNRLMVGWANYFHLGPVSTDYKALDRHARRRLRQWLRRKHKVPGQGTARYPDDYLHKQLGLVELRGRTRNLPWANA